MPEHGARYLISQKSLQPLLHWTACRPCDYWICTRNDGVTMVIVVVHIHDRLHDRLRDIRLETVLRTKLRFLRKNPDKYGQLAKQRSESKIMRHTRCN